MALTTATSLVGSTSTATAVASVTAGTSGTSGPGLSESTAYFAEQPGTPPTYIFPLVSSGNYTLTNVNDLQPLLYRPLYWYGDNGSTGLDPGRSLADPPVYSRADRVVTFTLKDYRWSDGEKVSARDVIFWMNLLKAEKANWAGYVPGAFPDNVVSAVALGASSVRLTLNASYNPTWFTMNELSQITPLPLAWDRTALSGPTPNDSTSKLPDVTRRGAKAVYALLNRLALESAGWVASRIWSVVDGPWKLSGATAEGRLTFIPNRLYSGADRAHLARFVELPFTGSSSEFESVRAGSAIGGRGGDNQVSVGYIPANDLPERSVLKAQGYKLVNAYPFQFNYFEPNFNNPKVGPIFRQLYFRQAFQRLVNQSGWMRTFFGGVAVATNGPVPVRPANPYADQAERTDPYPFDPVAARRLLVAHGWTVRPGGVSTCDRPGTAAADCGRGIAKGEGLRFNLLFVAGLPYTDESMQDLVSVAAKVGIQIYAKAVSNGVIYSTILACAPTERTCGWQLGQYGVGWVFTPDHYPSGEDIFQTGAQGNVSNYSNAAVDKLIVASTRATPATAQAALDRYQNAVRLDLPDFWQPSPGSVTTLQGNLRGYSTNSYGFINSQDWYFSAATP